ncbi:hypothetical protein [Nannocystis pusilla]|uniref:hypothetical protein n=1 Tax=Nannocystis pusilla TaxID=889268 RepID=UPI003DA330BB
MAPPTHVLLAIALAGAGLFAPASARAADPHFTQPPEFNVSGQTLTVFGSAADLGDAPVEVHLTAHALVFVTCVNAQGKIVPAHTQQLAITGTTVEEGQPEGGELDFVVDLTLTIPFSCPSTKWSQLVISDFVFDEALLTIERDGVTLLSALDEF